ncbi:hypothetical protein RFI_35793, partial [Reticulomyxa filosa]
KKNEERPTMMTMTVVMIKSFVFGILKVTTSFINSINTSSAVGIKLSTFNNGLYLCSPHIIIISVYETSKDMRIVQLFHHWIAKPNIIECILIVMDAEISKNDYYPTPMRITHHKGDDGGRTLYFENIRLYNGIGIVERNRPSSIKDNLYSW